MTNLIAFPVDKVNLTKKIGFTFDSKEKSCKNTSISFFPPITFFFFFLTKYFLGSLKDEIIWYTFKDVSKIWN